jgi:predicted proteasome-type protease
LKLAIENEEDGFEAVIQIVTENLEQSNTLLKQIDTARNNSNKNLVEIEKEKETITLISEYVARLKEKSQIDREEIGKYLAIASDASFADSFNNRKTELSDNAKLWRWIYL